MQLFAFSIHESNQIAIYLKKKYIEILLMINSTLKEEIKKALDRSFPKRQDLQEMLRTKLDRKIFDFFGNERLNCSISDLIADFERISSLDELIISAIRKNCRNEYLRSLSSRIEEINDTVQSHQLSQDFNDLWEIISTIKKQIIINEILRVLSLFDNIEEEKQDYKQKLKELQEIENYHRCLFKFVLKKTLLVERETSSNGTKTIIHFAEYLLDCQDVENSTRNQLRNWIDNFCSQNNLTRPNVSSNSQPYLFIIISYETHNFRLSPFLLISDFQNRKSLDPIKLQTKEGYEEAGIRCNDFEEIKIKIKDIIEKVEYKLFSFQITEQNLIIQFFLPLECLSEKVEDWEYYIKISTIEKKVVIGRKYGIVVRSYDRFKRYELMRKLADNIKKFESKGEIYHFNNVNEFLNNWDTLQDELECRRGLRIDERTIRRKEITPDFFVNIISSCVVIALCNFSNNLNSESIDHVLLNLNSLTNLNELFPRILKLRKSSRANHDILLLCEYPPLDSSDYELLNPQLKPPNK